MRLLVLARIAVILAAVAASSAAASISAQASRSRFCGLERWPVKTLTDPAAVSVNFRLVASTVDRLRRLRVPRVRARTPRIRVVETTTYRIRVRLLAMKREPDHDIHLVVASPRTGRTMIVEFPDRRCTAGAVRRRQMTAARAAIERACGRPPTMFFRRLTGSATITGVGLVDTIHGQKGIAPNGIELHPALAFTPASCRRA